MKSAAAMPGRRAPLPLAVQPIVLARRMVHIHMLAAPVPAMPTGVAAAVLDTQMAEKGGDEDISAADHRKGDVHQSQHRTSCRNELAGDCPRMLNDSMARRARNSTLDATYRAA